MNLFQGLLFLDGFRVAPEPAADRPVVAGTPAGKRRGAATTATAKRAMPARARTLAHGCNCAATGACR